MILNILKKMIDYSNGNHHDIHHFIKVYTFAKMIGEQEHLDAVTLEILEIASITHDIACPLCRLKYGKAYPKNQEEEGMLLVREFLEEFSINSLTLERIVYLVGHHHTLDRIEGIDYQILIEADYLVNAYESQYSFADIQAFSEKYFKTKTGLSLIKSMYLR